MVQGGEIKEGDTILKIEDIYMYFGKVAALAGVSLEVKKGEIHSIIGPNGAGKTVMMNCINGLYHPQKGNIYYKGEMIDRLSPHKRAELGIGRTFQKLELYGGMTVLDNIRMGSHIHLKTGVLSGSVYVGKTKKEEIKEREFIEQKRVELGRALALRPEVILLDEPMAGLNLEEVEDMARFILDINEEERWRTTCVLVEHDMGVVMDISHSVLVLNFGNVITDGPPEEVGKNPEVVKAYLGEEDLYISRR
ncbi:MAG: ABC transporter ATP-binding protein [Deltaproteobacteria bacterium]|nr:ABC transporter ATP-binding protein [Deltaproteobacteria bacterium]